MKIIFIFILGVIEIRRNSEEEVQGEILEQSQHTRKSFSKSAHRVSQKGSYTEHRCSCALLPVKLRDKKIRRKRRWSKALKMVVIEYGKLLWLICRGRFPLFFHGVGKRLP
jgi:hypothetical protein